MYKLTDATTLFCLNTTWHTLTNFTRGLGITITTLTQLESISFFVSGADVDDLINHKHRDTSNQRSSRRTTVAIKLFNEWHCARLKGTWLMSVFGNELDITT